MQINREQYLNELIIRKNNGMIKVITGIRRCGKSYLLFNLFKDYLLNTGVDTNHIIEIALDGIDSEDLREPKTCFSYIKSHVLDNNIHYVLLDEVQFLPRFEEVLNSLLRIRNLDIYVTGSNSKFLSKDIITEFRGRGDEVHIYPLSFSEFYAAYTGDYEEAWNEYTKYGGLPALMEMKTSHQKEDYLKHLFDNVYLNDVIERNGIRAKDDINTLVDILASAIGSPTNPTKISNTFLTERHDNYTNKTISAHIDFLEEAFLISKANKYDIKGRKYVGTNLKYYFTDIGLRNARLNFRQQEITHILENLVYNELLIRGYSVDVGLIDVFQKSTNGNSVRKQLEVDFVANLGNNRCYIQVAYELSTEEKKQQEFNSFRHIPDSFKKIVLINGSQKPWRNDEGYVIMGLKYFFLEPKSLEF